MQRLGAFEVPFCDVTWLSQMGCPMEEHGISWEVPRNFGGLEVTSGTWENSGCLAVCFRFFKWVLYEVTPNSGMIQGVVECI